MDQTSAISWASIYVEFGEQCLLHNRPWSSVWRLSEKGKNYYLKQIKCASTFEARTLEWLSQIVPQFIPEVVASNENNGFILLREAEGQKAESFLNVMVHYGRLQYELLCSRKVQLFYKKIDSNNNLALTFLREIDKCNSNNKLKYVLDYPHEKLAKKLEINNSIPYTINHCDLQCDHVIINSRDTSIFLDWSDAVFGPLFMSFVSAFGAIRTLQMAENRDEKIQLFTEELQPFYNISHQKLVEYLPPILLTGLIYHWLDFKSYDDEFSKSQMQIIENELYLLLDY